MGCCFSSSNRHTPSLPPTLSHPPCLNPSNGVLQTPDTSMPDFTLSPSTFDEAGTHTLSHLPYMNDSYHAMETSGVNIPEITLPLPAFGQAPTNSTHKME